MDANNPMNYGMVEAQGAGIGGGISAGDGQSHVTFYVQVDNPQAYLDKAESLGGKTLMAPMAIPDGPTIAMFADPEGHAIGLVSG